VDIPAAGAIIFDSAGRLLVIRRLRPPAAGRWSVPGGKCRPGETAAEACVRECLEETGLLVEVGGPAGQVCLPATGSDRFVIEDFRCTVVGGTGLAGDDAAELRWVNHAELQRLPLVSGLLETLARWNLLPAASD
jgi:8-oxo-dGTP diphosphatase